MIRGGGIVKNYGGFNRRSHKIGEKKSISRELCLVTALLADIHKPLSKVFVNADPRFD